MKSVSFALMFLTGLLPSAGQGRQVRVCVQYVELPHAELGKLLAASPGNAVLHGKAMELVRANKARIVETCIGVCQSGGQASVGSVREEIFPTGLSSDTPSFSIGGTAPANNHILPSGRYHTPKHRSYTAFESRNTGTTLKFIAEPLPGGRFIQLQLAPEISNRVRLDMIMEYKDKHGDASIRMPVYEMWRTDTSLTVRAGQFSLVSVYSPKRQAPAPFVESRILLFVRPDVLAAP